jgi:putative acetyltransferase
VEAISIELALGPTDDVRVLVGELEGVLSADYPPEQRHGLPLDAIFQSHIRFFLARVEGATVGCGGVALFSDFAEVKRMYVREAARGSGVAGALLDRIERETRDTGLDLLCLETGDRALAAHRFYERSGFRRCAAFGAYASMTPAAIATSIFYEKRLGAGSDRH